MMASAKQQPTDVVFFGNLDAWVTRSMLHELSVQAGPVARVTLPVVKPGTTEHRGYGFAQYTSLESAKYAYELFQGTVKLFGRQVRVGFSPQGNPGTTDS
jgi:RNA recognition motif-containing protein